MTKAERQLRKAQREVHDALDTWMLLRVEQSITGVSCDGPDCHRCRAWRVFQEKLSVALDLAHEVVGGLPPLDPAIKKQVARAMKVST